MFNGGQYSESIYDGNQEDQDYVNVPPLRSKKVSPKMLKLDRDASKTPQKKTRYRRGSQTLKIPGARRPSILDKIEKQVLAYVPILGEPTPEPKKAQSSPLSTFEFPPPPVGIPSIEVRSPQATVSAVTSYVNPMYSPTTATPGCDLDSSNPFNKPNAYFSY
jgi:hypothetical protein